VVLDVDKYCAESDGANRPESTGLLESEQVFGSFGVTVRLDDIPHR